MFTSGGSATDSGRIAWAMTELPGDWPRWFRYARIDPATQPDT